MGQAAIARENRGGHLSGYSHTPQHHLCPFLRSTPVPEHCQKRSSDRSLVFPSDSMLWCQAKPPVAVYGKDVLPIFCIPNFYQRVHNSCNKSLQCRGTLAHQARPLRTESKTKGSKDEDKKKKE